MTTSTWTHLPNLRAFSLTEGLRLSLIVGSLVTIALAGQLAQSRANNSDQVEIPHVATAVISAPAHKISATEKYAKTQIQTFADLLDGLTERAEVILDTTQVSPQAALEMKNSLKQLDEDLMTARESLAHYAKKSDRFAKEELKESLMAVQDSATFAQSQIITLDQAN